MIEESRNDSDEEILAPEPNADLIYSYTAELIKAQNKSLNRLDAKLSGFLAFVGVLVTAFSDFT